MCAQFVSANTCEDGMHNELYAVIYPLQFTREEREKEPISLDIIVWKKKLN